MPSLHIILEGSTTSTVLVELHICRITMSAVDPDRYRAIELKITEDVPKDEHLRHLKCAYRSFNAVLESGCKAQLDHLFPLFNLASCDDDLINWSSELEGSSLEKSAEFELKLVTALAEKYDQDLHVVNVHDLKHGKGSVCATTTWTLLQKVVHDVPMLDKDGRENPQIGGLAAEAYSRLRWFLHERRSKRENRQTCMLFQLENFSCLPSTAYRTISGKRMH